MAFDQRASSKPPGRSRWNANQQQLQTLESIFEQGNGITPNRARIKDIAIELIQFGQISETNVYNWFQNRKARAKRKLQHQVGRRRRLTRTTTSANALKLNRNLGLDEAKAGNPVGTEPTSPKAKRVKTTTVGDCQLSQIDDQSNLISQLAPNPDFGSGSSGVEDHIAGVLEAADLRSHVDFATLATDHSQLPSVENITHDMLFSDDDHFHEQGTVESPNGQLHETSEEVIKAWEDVRTSFGDSTQMVDSVQAVECLISSTDATFNNFPSSLVNEDKLVSLEGGPVPSVDEDPDQRLDEV